HPLPIPDQGVRRTCLPHDPRPSAPMVSSHPRLYLIFWY
ncbi:hypothetical protein NOIMNB_NOIMNB_17825, partial [Dysosmobacter welbionis]